MPLQVARAYSALVPRNAWSASNNKSKATINGQVPPVSDHVAFVSHRQVQRGSSRRASWEARKDNYSNTCYSETNQMLLILIHSLVPMISASTLVIVESIIDQYILPVQ